MASMLENLFPNLTSKKKSDVATSYAGGLKSGFELIPNLIKGSANMIKNIFSGGETKQVGQASVSPSSLAASIFPEKVKPVKTLEEQPLQEQKKTILPESIKITKPPISDYAKGLQTGLKPLGTLIEGVRKYRTEALEKGPESLIPLIREPLPESKLPTEEIKLPAPYKNMESYITTQTKQLSEIKYGIEKKQKNIENLMTDLDMLKKSNNINEYNKKVNIVIPLVDTLQKEIDQYNASLSGFDSIMKKIDQSTGEQLLPYKSDKYIIPKEFKIGDAIKLVAEGLLRLPREISTKFTSLRKGITDYGSVVQKDIGDIRLEEAAKEREKFIRDISVMYKDNKIGPFKATDLAELPTNLAYSLTTMGLSIPSTIVAGPVAGPIGAALISEYAARKMSQQEFIQNILDTKNDESLKNKGRGITLEEENKIKKDYELLAKKYGLYESIPEGASNALGAVLLMTKLGPVLGANIATKLISKLGGWSLGELGTEALTQMGQVGIMQETGLPGGRNVDWTSIPDWITSIKEVAPQTMLLSLFMGGAGSINLAIRSLKSSIGETHPSYQFYKQKLEEFYGKKADDKLLKLDESAFLKVEKEATPIERAVRTFKNSSSIQLAKEGFQEDSNKISAMNISDIKTINDLKNTVKKNISSESFNSKAVQNWLKSAEELYNFFGGKKETQLIPQKQPITQTQIIDQMKIKTGLINKKITDIAKKIGRIETGEILTKITDKAPLAKKINALKDIISSKIDSPGQFFSEVAKVIKQDTSLTEAQKDRAMSDLKETTNDLFIPLKTMEISNKQATQLVYKPVKEGITYQPSAEVSPQYRKMEGKTSDILTQILRGTKGMTADYIMQKYPDIKLTKDVPAKDIYNNKVEISKNEILTPYELKGNKILLQDGQAYVVSKNQFTNIKGNAVSKEAKEFAPELKGTEEVVKGLEKMSSEERKKFKELDNQIDIEEKIKTKAIENNNQKLIEKQNDKINELMKEWQPLRDKMYKGGVTYGFTRDTTKFSQYQLPGGYDYKEIIIRAPEVKGQPTFTSPHFPDEKNPISHLRVKKYKTDKYGQVTFMEEMQSDWAREGRQKGFINSAEKTFNAGIKEKYPVPMDESVWNVKILEDAGVPKELTDQWYSDNIATTRHGSIPSNPLLKNWQILTIKRALQEAVKGDADYFAWINGEQTTARYDLTTYVESVEWTGSITNRVIKIIPSEGRKIEFQTREDGTIYTAGGGIPTEWTGKKLDEVLGKGLADKIMSKESGTLSGEGLKFGGEWANNLYDKQIPNIVKDLTDAPIEKLDMKLPISADTEKMGIWVRSDKVKAGESIADSVKNARLESKDLKVGMEINRSQYGVRVDSHIITDILGEGKFKAVPKYIWERKETFKETGQPSDWLDKQKETFDIFQKLSPYQQGIKLTPEIKAKIRGEVPSFKASGEMFTEKPNTPVETFRRLFGAEKNLVSSKIEKKEADIIIKKMKIEGIYQQFVDAIKSSDNKEAFAVAVGDTISYIKGLVPKFTGAHEIQHIVFNILDDMKIFQDKGITQKTLTDSLIKNGLKLNFSDPFGEIKNYELRGINNLIETEKKNYHLALQDREKITEKLSDDFTKFLQEKEDIVNGKKVKSSISGKIKEFFEEIWNFIKEIVSPKNREVLDDYFNTLAFGEAKEPTQVGRTSDAMIKELTSESVLDFKKISEKYPTFLKKETEGKPKTISEMLNKYIEKHGVAPVFIPKNSDGTVDQITTDSINKSRENQSTQEFEKDSDGNAKLLVQQEPEMINVERASIDKSLQQELIRMAEKLRPELEKIKKLTKEGGITHADIIKEAIKAKMFNDIIDVNKTLRYTGRVVKTRKVLNDFAEMTATGKILSQEEMKKYENIFEVVSSIRTHLARSLESLKITISDFNIPGIGEFSPGQLKNELMEELIKLGAKEKEVFEKAQGVNFENAKEVTQFYREFVRPHFTEMFDEYRYFNMLFTPKPHLKNIISNTVNSLIYRPMIKTFQGIDDIVASTLTGKAREYYISEVPVYYKGLFNSTGIAARDALGVLTGKKMITRPDLRRIGTGIKILDYMRFVGKALDAVDIFAINSFSGGEANSIAYRMIKQGKSIDQQVLDNIQNEATDIAKRYLYRAAIDPTGKKTGQGYANRIIDVGMSKINSLRQHTIINVPVGKIIGKKIFQPISSEAKTTSIMLPSITNMVIPFLNIWANVTKQSLELMPGANIANYIGNKNKSEQMAKIVFGNLLALWIGYEVIKGNITGPAPDDPEERKVWYNAGNIDHAWTFRFGEHKITIPLEWFGTMGIAMEPVVDYVWYFAKNPEKDLKNSAQKMFDLILLSSKNFLKQSFVSSVSNLLDASQGDEYAFKNFIGNTISQLVPASGMQRWFAQIIDNTYRKTDPGFSWETIRQQIERGTPFLNKRLPFYETPEGLPSKRNFYDNFLPYNVNILSGDALKNAEKLYDLFIEVKKTKIESKKRQQEIQENGEAEQKIIEISKMPSYRHKAELEKIRKEDPILHKEINKLWEADLKQLANEIKQKIKNWSKLEQDNYIYNIENRNLQKTVKGELESYEIRILKGMDIWNGDRTREIIKMLDDFSTNQEKKAFYNNLQEQKIITPEVRKQLKRKIIKSEWIY